MKHIIALLAAFTLAGCATPEDLRHAEGLTQRSATGDARAGDSEVDTEPMVAYTTTGDNEQSKNDFEIKRDINNAAQAPGSQTGIALSAMGDVRRLLKEDPILASITQRMNQIGTAAAAATTAEEAQAFEAQLQAQYALYREHRQTLLEAAESAATVNMPNLTNMTVVNINETTAGAEADPLPDSYANAAATIAEKLASLKGNNGQ